MTVDVTGGLALRIALLGAVLVVALVIGLRRRRTDGEGHAVTAGEVLGADDLGAPLGERATLVQVSTQFCSPCRAARAVLGPLADELPGVVHREVAAEDHVDLVRRLDVTRTPTLLVLDPAGRVVARAEGVPTRDQVVQALFAVPEEAVR